LRDTGLADALFDVITMSHVIEHVHDPVALLKECHRILKPGGSLIAVTPNANAYGHHRFRSNWMPLEPPRHLHLFSPPTLRQIARLAGFRQQECWTTAAKAQFFYEASRDIERLGHHDVNAHPGILRGLLALAFQFRAMAVHALRKDSGDECVLRARK
jgi:2-polyprenyl-3-methyl-5-hydroxy-6-metoxy-1,4-benzoquinol methylase